MFLKNKNLKPLSKPRYAHDKIQDYNACGARNSVCPALCLKMKGQGVSYFPCSCFSIMSDTLFIPSCTSPRGSTTAYPRRRGAPGLRSRRAGFLPERRLASRRLFRPNRHGVDHKTIVRRICYLKTPHARRCSGKLIFFACRDLFQNSRAQ